MEWNLSVVLKYIKSFQALKQCEFKSLLYRLTIPFCIKTGRREQILLYMNIDSMILEADKATIFVPELLKQLRPVYYLKPMVLLEYPDREICVVSHLEQYTEKTKNLQKDQNLLISFAKPKKSITTSTISRWCVTVLKNVGVDVTVFGSHSTISVSTTNCKEEGTFNERNK